MGFCPSLHHLFTPGLSIWGWGWGSMEIAVSTGAWSWKEMTFVPQTWKAFMGWCQLQQLWGSGLPVHWKPWPAPRAALSRMQTVTWNPSPLLTFKEQCDLITWKKCSSLAAKDFSFPAPISGRVHLRSQDCHTDSDLFIFSCTIEERCFWEPLLKTKQN